MSVTSHPAVVIDGRRFHPTLWHHNQTRSLGVIEAVLLCGIATRGPLSVKEAMGFLGVSRASASVRLKTLRLGGWLRQNAEGGHELAPRAVRAMKEVRGG